MADGLNIDALDLFGRQAPKPTPQQPTPDDVRLGFGSKMAAAGGSGIQDIDVMDLLGMGDRPTQQRQQQSAQPKINLAEDIGKSTAAGVAQGGIGMLALPDTMIQLAKQGATAGRNWLESQGVTTPTVEDPRFRVGVIGSLVDILAGPKGERVNTGLPTYKGTKDLVEGVTGKFYEPKTIAGEYARTGGEFASGMLLPGGATTMLGKAVTNVAMPAAASETAGQLTKGTSWEPYARVAGGLAGGMFGAKKLGQQQRKAVETLKKEGIPITAGQQTGSSKLKYLESSSIDTFGAGNRMKNIMEQQGKAYTEAALKRVGITKADLKKAGVADEALATPEVMDYAFTKMGKEFDDLARNASITPKRWKPAAYTDRLQRIKDVGKEYIETTPADKAMPLVKNLSDELADMVVNRRPMYGPQYQGYRTRIDQAQRGTQDAGTARALYEIKDWLDDMMSINATPAQKAAWSKVRREYRNIIPIEKAVLGAGEATATGLIPPARLSSAVKGMDNRGYVRGKGDFADLVRAGDTLLRPLPQSGTAPRQFLNMVGTLLGAGVGGATTGGAGAVVGALAGPAALARAGTNRFTQRLMRQNPSFKANYNIAPGLSAQSEK